MWYLPLEVLLLAIKALMNKKDEHICALKL